MKLVLGLLYFTICLIVFLPFMLFSSLSELAFTAIFNRKGLSKWWDEQCDICKNISNAYVGMVLMNTKNN